MTESLDLSLLGLKDVYMKYQRFVRGVAYKVVGNLAQAEDITQEVFVTLHRELSKRPEGLHIHTSLRAYLARCTTNAALNAIRSESRRTNMQDRLLADAGDSETASPPAEDSVMRKESVNTISAALSELGERDRTILILRHSGLSYRELAEAVGARESSVGKLIERAHVRFSVIYRGLGGGDEG